MSTRKKKRPPLGWRSAFLTALSQTGNVMYASRTAQVLRGTAYKARERDAKFAELWDDALDEAADALELEARRRSMNGVEREVHVRSGTDARGRPIFEKKTIKEFSDVLLIFLLKGVRPEKFRENYDFAKVMNAISATSSNSDIPRVAEDQGGKRQP